MCENCDKRREEVLGNVELLAFQGDAELPGRPPTPQEVAVSAGLLFPEGSLIRAALMVSCTVFDAGLEGEDLEQAMRRFDAETIDQAKHWDDPLYYNLGVEIAVVSNTIGDLLERMRQQGGDPEPETNAERTAAHGND